MKLEASIEKIAIVPKSLKMKYTCLYQFFEMFYHPKLVRILADDIRFEDE